MKTSNKILVGLYLGILLIAISAMAYVRVNTFEVEPLSPIGDVRTENINIPYLNFLEASVGNITLVQGEPKIEITCAENIFPHIKRGFENGKYYIHKKRESQELIEFDVRVYTNDLKKIVLHQNVHLNSEKPLQIDSLELETFNGSMVELELNTDVISIRSYNSSRVILEGTANEVIAQTQNVGIIDGEKMMAQAADVAAGNSSHINIHAVEKLAVSVSNVGQVSYWGNPQVIQQSVIDAAQLRHMEKSH